MLLSSLSLSVPLAREQGPLCPRDCMGRGLCTGSGVCICNETFSGAACDRASSRCPAQCSGHGSCSVDGCTCDIGYGGDDCFDQGEDSGRVECLKEVFHLSPL